MSMTKTGSAVWQGSLKEGKGQVSTESGALKELPYSFGKRFEARFQPRGVDRGSSRQLLLHGAIDDHGRGGDDP